MQLHNPVRMHNVRYAYAMATEPRYVSANLTPDAAARLRALTATMTIERGKRVTTSELVIALANLAEKHKGDLLVEIAPDDGRASRAQ